MREILFRGFCKDNAGVQQIQLNGETINGHWVYGFMSSLRTIAYEGVIGYDEFVVIPETVGQFTGLLDKNGKRIFEGDVLSHNWSSVIPAAIMEVVFDRGSFFLEPIKGRTETHGEDIWKIHAHIRDSEIDEYSEVIGTIFDKEATPCTTD